MTNNNVWFITGAGRGMGVDITQAALAGGHRVVATARDAAKAAAAVGEHENLLTVSLDITDTDSIDAAVKVATERFGRLDVLVNNAGNFQPGFFEEVSPEQFRAQMETNFFGPLNVTRAVLPIMRASGPATSSPSLRQRASSPVPSVVHTAHRNSLWKAGPNRFAKRSSSSASGSPRSNQDSSAPNSLVEGSPPAGPSCRSMTTPQQPRKPSKNGSR